MLPCWKTRFQKQWHRVREWIPGLVSARTTFNTPPKQAGDISDVFKENQIDHALC